MTAKGRRSHVEDVPAAKLDNVSNRMNSVVKTPKGKAVGALDTMHPRDAQRCTTDTKKILTAEPPPAPQGPGTYFQSRVWTSQRGTGRCGWTAGPHYL